MAAVASSQESCPAARDKCDGEVAKSGATASHVLASPSVLSWMTVFKKRLARNFSEDLVRSGEHAASHTP